MGTHTNGFSRRRFLDVVATGTTGLTLANRLARRATAAEPAMTHRQRVECALARRPTDRLPFPLIYRLNLSP